MNKSIIKYYIQFLIKFCQKKIDQRIREGKVGLFENKENVYEVTSYVDKCYDKYGYYAKIRHNKKSKRQVYLNLRGSDKYNHSYLTSEVI